MTFWNIMLLLFSLSALYLLFRVVTILERNQFHLKYIGEISRSHSDDVLKAIDGVGDEVVNCRNGVRDIQEELSDVKTAVENLESRNT